jgi:hypothetical protein
MVRLALMAACCVLAVGTAAQAQSVNVTNQNSGTDITFGASDFRSFPGPSNGVQTATSPATGTTTSSGFASSLTVDPNSISFTNGNAQSGLRTSPSVTSTSFTDLGLRVTNDGNAAGEAILHSQITPASIGFYMANTANCGSTFTTCAQSQGIQTLSQLSHSGLSGPVGGASFDFQINQGDATLLSLTGTMTLNLNSDGFAGVVSTNFGRAGDGGLTNFHQVDLGNAGSAIGFAWDTTDVDVDLGMLDPDNSTSLSYSLSVSSFTNGACLSDGVTCLVAYSSFGDPIGSAGAVTNAARFGLGGLFGSNDGPLFITGLNFGQVTVDAPTASIDMVPEPATWLSMILGFGVMGAALRRRRVVAYN